MISSHLKKKEVKLNQWRAVLIKMLNHTTITVPRNFLERLQRIAPHGAYHKFLSELINEYEKKRKEESKEN